MSIFDQIIAETPQSFREQVEAEIAIEPRTITMRVVITHMDRQAMIEAILKAHRKYRP